MIKSQYQEMLDVIKKDQYAMISLSFVCNDTGEQTVNYQNPNEYRYDEQHVILSSLLSLLGLLVVKLTFVYHGDDYHKIRYFFISKDEEKLIEPLEKELALRR